MNGQTKEEINYKDTLNLPQTDFPMRGDGPRREPEFQKFWFENKIYEKVLENNKKKNLGRYLLHDGPPYLSSPNIHIGTALNKILKDIIIKYKTIRGFYSPYLPGYDCHGLPIETSVLEKLKTTRDKINPVELRKKCAEFAKENRFSQTEKFKRLGVLGNFDNAYMTMDPKFEAMQLKLFSEMIEKGYIYRGLKSVYWCPSCQTALAEAEIEYVENFKSPSIYVSFSTVHLSKNAQILEKYNNLKVVIWTTTPWTIPGNLAICLHPDFDYVVLKSLKYGYLLLAEGLVNEFLKTIEEECPIVQKLKGVDLEHTICQHPIYKRESPIILGHHVTLETGTGCVHTAPGHGLEDFEIGQKYKLEVLSPVDERGHFTQEAGEEFKGLHVHKQGNSKVIEALTKAGALIKEEAYLHSYPHCWRSKSPIIFRATDQWFCSVDGFRELALKVIDNVTWIPSVGRNRIYSMVETRTDWCISRQRIWGVPIPALYCESCNEVHLNKKIIQHIIPLVEKYGTDVWYEKETNDFIPTGYRCKCGGVKFKKETDTMDVWFDSGSTHFAVVDAYAELGGSPSEMYLEGSDQHRGWFQSSLLTSVATKGQAPYKTVLTHGFVLDENGRKMSKSLGNVVDPQDVIKEYGADILRLWVSSVDYSTDMRIGQNMLKQLAEVYRNIRNTARFILGNLYDFNPKENYVPYGNLWNIDKYGLHKLEEIKEEVTKDFDNYEFYRYYQILQNYCAVDLSSFYFDLNKDRLYTAGKNSLSRRSTQTVLYEILNFLLRVLASVLPHLAEDIWKYKPPLFINDHDSVLFLDWPLSNMAFKNEILDVEFANILLVKNIVFKALEIARQDKKIGKSLEAKVILYPKNEKLYETLKKYENELPTIFIVSQILIKKTSTQASQEKEILSLSKQEDDTCLVIVLNADGNKCPRCWKWATDIGQDKRHSSICVGCVKAVEGVD